MLSPAVVPAPWGVVGGGQRVPAVDVTPRPLPDRVSRQFPGHSELRPAADHPEPVLQRVSTVAGLGTAPPLPHPPGAFTFIFLPLGLDGLDPKTCGSQQEWPWGPAGRFPGDPRSCRRRKSPFMSHSPPTLVMLDVGIDPLCLKTGRSNKRKSEEVNGEAKQEAMSVEKEEEELEEKVRAGAVGGRGLGRPLCRGAGFERLGPGERRVLSYPFLPLSRSKMRKGLKSKPKKGKEEGERSLLWVGVRPSVRPPLPSAAASLARGRRRCSASSFPLCFLTPRSEIKDEITQVKTTTPAKVSSFSSISAFLGGFLNAFDFSKLGLDIPKGKEKSFPAHAASKKSPPRGRWGAAQPEPGLLLKPGLLVCCRDAFKKRGFALTNGLIWGRSFEPDRGLIGGRREKPTPPPLSCRPPLPSASTAGSTSTIPTSNFSKGILTMP